MARSGDRRVSKPLGLRADWGVVGGQCAGCDDCEPSGASRPSRDDEIERMARVPVPQGLTERILLDVRLRTDRNSRRMVALAAVAGSAAVVVMTLFALA